VVLGKGDELAAAGQGVLKLLETVHAGAETRPGLNDVGVLNRVAREKAVTLAKIVVDAHLPEVHRFMRELSVVGVGGIIERQQGPYRCVHGYGITDQSTAVGGRHGVVRAIRIALGDGARPIGPLRRRQAG